MKAQHVLWNLKNFKCSEIFDALHAGANYHAPDPASGLLPLSLLSPCKEAAEGMKALSLITAGANPLLQGVFAQILAGEYGNEELYAHALPKAINLHYTDETGNNALHLMAKNLCARLAHDNIKASFQALELTQEKGRQAPMRKQDLIGQRNEAGNTPLHCLFEAGNSLHQALDRLDGSPGNSPYPYAMLHYTTLAQWMQSKEDLFVKNDAGHTVIDLIIQALDRGCPAPSSTRPDQAGLCDLIQAYQHAGKLEDDTASVGRSLPARRM